MTRRSAKLHNDFRKKILADPEMRAEYAAFKLQLEVADQLKKAREKKHLTQENIAKAMGTQKSTIARIEAAGGKSQHSPSLKTLVKYASATGCTVQIKVVPVRNRKKI